MVDDYLSYYILSYFDTKKVTTISQILHVFHAKRTPSMFYLIEINGWHHGFSLFKKMTREYLNRIVKKLEKHRYVVSEDKGYLLTETGFNQVNAYFEDHYYPKNVKRFINANARLPFWNRVQLYTQVFSEMSYHNTRYTPVVKHPYHQENVRLLFQRFGENREKLLKQWLEEQQFIFSQLEELAANVLVNQLTGHQWIGKTRKQIAEFYQMNEREFTFYLYDSLEAVIQLIECHKDKLPFHYSVITSLHEETHWGLSASTLITYQMLKKGANFSQIAKQRSIKENTVREHILEIAFTFEKFPYKNFVPKELYDQLHQQFREKENLTFQEALDRNEHLEFMHYRLVELERMRSK